MSALPTRADYVAGLRELADFVEATEVPLPTYQMTLSGSLATYAAYRADDEASVAQVGRAAQVLGVELVTRDVGANRHHTADRAFGPIELHFSYVENGAAKDIPGEGGEVASPDGRSGSATAPTEDSPGRVEEGTGLAATALERQAEPVTEAAVPAPVGSGDGAAVTPDVWVPIRRRGTNYHRPGEQRSTTCGRNMFPNGVRLLVDEALTFGAVPCPRCYGGVQ